MLQTRRKWQKPYRNVSVDDIVLLIDDNTPRNSWALARVVGVDRDEDGYVRKAEVATSNSIYRRPVHKLIPLVTKEPGDQFPDGEPA